MARDTRFTDLAMKLGLVLQLAAILPDDLVDEPEAGIVWCLLVFGAGITQPHNEPDRIIRHPRILTLLQGQLLQRQSLLLQRQRESCGRWL